MTGQTRIGPWCVEVASEAGNMDRDFKHAARSLVRVPGFTFIVVLTLALAIGANAAIFSVVNAVLLEPMPFPNADRLVYIGGTAPGTDQPAEFGVADELYFEYKESVPGLEDIGALRHRFVDDARGTTGRPAVRDAGDAVVLHDARRSARCRPAAERQGRRQGRRHQRLDVEDVVRLRRQGDRPELLLRGRRPHGHRHHATGIQVPR